MPLNDTIDALANATLVVTRRATGTLVAGVYTPGATTTFTIAAVAQPAFNLNRVIGGADLEGTLENQQVVEIYQLHTRTELKTRTPTTDPDVVSFKNASWTVSRVEEWNLNGESHYHVVITKQTQGAS